MSIQVGHEGLVVTGDFVPLLSASVHYWRHERTHWEPILDSVKELGFRIVETYVPWGVHERVRGHFDWTRERDLPGFLDAAAKRGLKVILRPGPHINAELPTFGFPPRVLFDARVQARTSQGALAHARSPTRHFPIPSYASEKFWEEVGGWFDAMAPLVKPRLHPRGPVIALQADNETSYFFRWETFDLDYAEDSIGLYRTWLSERFRDVGALNRRYGTSHRDFDGIDPPRRFDGSRKASLLACLDWAAYKEWQILYGIQRAARMLRERGLSGVPVTHNYPRSAWKPFDLGETENLLEVDVAGVDFYVDRRRWREIARRARVLAAMSRLPFAPEFGCGFWSSWPDPLGPEDLSFGSLLAFMHGLKAANWYMVVERERWTGGAITREGRVRPAFREFFRRFHAFIAASDLLRHGREVEVVILRGRASDRLLSAASDLRGAPAVLPREAYAVPASFGGRATARDFETLFEGSCEALERAGIDHDLGDTGISANALKRYRIAVVVTLESLGRADRERLEGFARDGGKVVFVPAPPSLDEDLEPAKGAFPAGSAFPARPAGLAALLGRLGVRPPDAFEGDGVIASFFRRGGSRIVFLANPGPEARQAMLKLPGIGRLQDVWRGDVFPPDRAGAVRIPMPPVSVRPLVLESRGVGP